MPGLAWRCLNSYLLTKCGTFKVFLLERWLLSVSAGCILEERFSLFWEFNPRRSGSSQKTFGEQVCIICSEIIASERQYLLVTVCCSCGVMTESLLYLGESIWLGHDFTSRKNALRKKKGRRNTLLCCALQDILSGSDEGNLPVSYPGVSVAH